jgi:hypothetical protein
MLAYGVTGAPRLLDLIQPAVIVGGVTLALVASQRRALNHVGSQVGMALLVAASGFLLAYFVQAKGWSYHALPLLGCSSIGLAAVLASATKPPRLLAVSAPAILLMPFAIAAQAAMREELPSPDLRRAVAGLRPGEGVGFIATDPALAWSITLQRDLRYASRYMGFWMMRAVVRNEQLGDPNPRLAALGRTVVSETVTDFRCTPPRRIIVARPRPGEDSFDILPFFLRDREFAELLSHYRVRSRTTLDTYELASPLPAPVPSICRAGT